MFVCIQVYILYWLQSAVDTKGVIKTNHVKNFNTQEYLLCTDFNSGLK